MLLTFLIALVTLSLLLFLLSMVWPPDSPWSPWWRTNVKVAKAIVQAAKITRDDVIYDLGCGDGTALITAAKLKGASGIGIEIDPSRVVIAKLRILLNRLGGKVTIHRGDLFKTDISSASVVFVYLIPKTLNRLEEKFRKELRPGTRIVSYVYPIPYFPQVASDTKHQVHVYEVPGRKRLLNNGKN